MGLERIPADKWKWFGNAGHLIVGHDCRFHMCTLIGDVLVSTVGQYLPDSNIRDMLAESRGKPIVGRGDARRADYMRKFGYDEIGAGRTFETMVFAIIPGTECAVEDCKCGIPTICGNELEMEGYNTAGEAAAGHMRLCEVVASRQIVNNMVRAGEELARRDRESNAEQT